MPPSADYYRSVISQVVSTTQAAVYPPLAVQSAPIALTVSYTILPPSGTNFFWAFAPQGLCQSQGDRIGGDQILPSTNPASIQVTFNKPGVYFFCITPTQPGPNAIWYEQRGAIVTINQQQSVARIPLVTVSGICF